MVALFALVTALSIHEFCHLINNNVKDVQVNTFICTAAGTYLFLAMAGYCSGFTMNVGKIVFAPYLVTIIYLFISELYLKAPKPIENWAYTMLSQMYVALPFSTINALAFQEVAGGSEAASPVNIQIFTTFTVIPLFVFIFLWINDTGAYLTGSLIGKHKLFPRVSPGKSWEGSIGGGVFVLLIAALIWFITENTEILQDLNLVSCKLSLLQWLGMGLVVVFFGTWGDLVESLFKRTLGIKDSGNILPGHGGMLDRFDSSLMAMPAVLVYLYTLQVL